MRKREAPGRVKPSSRAPHLEPEKRATSARRASSSTPRSRPWRIERGARPLDGRDGARGASLRERGLARRRDPLPPRPGRRARAARSSRRVRRAGAAQAGARPGEARRSGEEPLGSSPARRTVKVAPAPFCEETSSVPPCASVIERAMKSPSPAPRRGPARRRPAELLEDEALLVRRDPGTVVAHADRDVAVVGRRAHLDLVSRDGVLDRVPDEVHEHLTDPLLVAAHGRERRLHVGAHRHLFLTQVDEWRRRRVRAPRGSRSRRCR